MKSRWAVSLVMAAALALSLASGPAVGQDADMRSVLNRVDALQNQLGTMHAEMQDLQRVVYAGEPPPPRAPGGEPRTEELVRQQGAVTEARFVETDEAMRRLTGRLEEVSFRMEQLQARIEKLVADVDFRLSALEGGAGVAAPRAAAQPPVSGGGTAASTAVEPGSGYKPSSAPQILGTVPLDAGEQAPPVAGSAAVAAATVPAGTPEEQYQFAFNLLRQARYDEADGAFEVFISAHPDHALSENAAYWRGETYYARKLFDEASRVYARNMQRFPDGAKAPDNLVKLGMSLVNLRRFEEACQFFDVLTARFPEAPANIRQAAERGRRTADCS